MSTTLAQTITRAQELLRTARHATMATVNDDGFSPQYPVFLFVRCHAQPHLLGFAP